MADRLGEKVEELREGYAAMLRELQGAGPLGDDLRGTLERLGTKLKKLTGLVTGRQPDPDALRARYEALGGDGALRKALADEDRRFRKDLEVFRTYGLNWKRDRLRALNESMHQVQLTLRGERGLQEPTEAFRAASEPVVAALLDQARTLGPKLDTEQGRELLHRIRKQQERVERAKVLHASNKRILERAHALHAGLELHAADVEAVHEALETMVAQMRTELDNELQLKAMPLAERVAFLEADPKPVRDRLQRELRARYEELRKDGLARVKDAEIPFLPPVEPEAYDPVPVADLEAEISRLEALPMEELQGEAPETARLRRRYERAGGDRALFAKRTRTWKAHMRDREGDVAKLARELDERMTELQEQLAKVARNAERGQAKVRELEQREKELLEEQTGPAAGADVGADEGRRTLLERELARTRTNLANRRRVAEEHARARKTAEALIELERRNYETLADDDLLADLYPRPRSEDLYEVPVGAKLRELTGR